MRILVALILLLPGCLTVVDDSPTPSPTSSSKKGTNPALAGVTVDATLTSTGSRHALLAIARNQGPSEYYVSSICIPPWGDEVTDEDGDTVWPEPRFYCAAFGRSAFKPGERLEYRAWWNETSYDRDRSETARSAPGDYQWDVTFRAAKQGESGAEERITVSFDVRVS